MKRIIHDYSINNDYYVLVHNEQIQLYDDNAKKLAELINKSDKKFIIFFDNGSWSFNFTSRLYNYLVEDKAVSIIITSRIPEYYREMRNLHNIPNTIFNFDELISYENAKRIVLKLEEKLLPQDFDYNKIEGLALEARQKLNKIMPLSVGQASRISGISPADISVLLIALEQRRRSSDKDGSDHE